MTIKAGSEAKGGFYWKKGEWEIVTVEGKTGTLPGMEKVEYVWIPGLLFVPIAMVISIVYVIFFPFIGFAMLAKVITRKLRIMLAGSRRSGVEELTPHAAGEKHTR
jgi:hypothetical protein